MDNVAQSIRNQRRPKGSISAIATNYTHLRNPWVTAWWSASFPGFGQIILGSYMKGFLLIIWEVVINMKSHLNIAIVYSLTGRFEMAKNILDKRWLLLYPMIFIYSIWDSYRSTVDLNKLSILADREKSPLIPVKFSTMEIYYLDKKNPWVTLIWSALMPGAGHLYTHRLPAGFFLLLWWVSISNLSHFWVAIHYSLIGAFSQAVAVVDFQWMLFMPSIVGFSMFDSYVNTVEYNKLFEIEQSQFLRDNYQDPNFKMPL
jgi:hypothetical protein